MRSTPTTLVPPRFAHSLRIVRTGTDAASTVTRPLLNASVNCCAAAGAASTQDIARVSRVRRIYFLAPPPEGVFVPPTAGRPPGSQYSARTLVRRLLNWRGLNSTPRV